MEREKPAVLLRRQNPFENPTENVVYTPDYRAIVPQLDSPGCRLPLFPQAEERTRIRFWYLLAGAVLLLHALLVNLSAPLLYRLALELLRMRDLQLLDGNLPGNYGEIAEAYLMDSAIWPGIQMLVFLCCNVLVFFVGCRMTRIKPASLFRTKELTGGMVVRYVMVGLFIQMAVGYFSSGVEYLLNGVGLTAYSPDSANGSTMLQTLISVVYGCIVAPVTEELIYRGVFLKNMSRVSQRFGIFSSALFFGLSHENLPQFFLTFVLGIFLAYVTTKHDSLIPAILIHFGVNTFGVVMSLLYEWNEPLADGIYTQCFLVILFGGLAALIYTLVKERLPDMMPAQRTRGTRLALSSISLPLVFLFHFYVMLCTIYPLN